jgi:hypothetical protein
MYVHTKLRVCLYAPFKTVRKERQMHIHGIHFSVAAIDPLFFLLLKKMFQSMFQLFKSCAGLFVAVSVYLEFRHCLEHKFIPPVVQLVKQRIVV